MVHRLRIPLRCPRAFRGVAERLERLAPRVAGHVTTAHDADGDAERPGPCGPAVAPEELGPLPHRDPSHRARAATAQADAYLEARRQRLRGQRAGSR